MMQQIGGYILEFLDVRPKSSLREMNAGAAVFASAAQKRGIEHHLSPKGEGAPADWDIYILDASGDVPDAALEGSTNTALILQKPFSLWKCFYLRMRLPVKEIIRIRPETNHLALSMSSMGFLETFKRTYRDANLNKVGKFLVALKVALKPLGTYPIIVFVL